MWCGKNLTVATVTFFTLLAVQCFYRKTKWPLEIRNDFFLYLLTRGRATKLHRIKNVLSHCLVFDKHSQSKKQLKDIECSNDALVGRNKGIQGCNNSCYLDALLFSMFYATNAFKNILEKCNTDTDIAQSTRQALKDFVNQPLRSPEHFCSAKNMMKLRNLLSKYNPKILGSFQAVEDIVYLLFEDLLKEDKLIHYEDNTACMHVMYADTSSRNLVATIQNVFERSMMINDMKFRFVPSPGFIISLPFDKNKLFHYKAIFPVFELNIEHLISPQKCSECSENAVWETAPIRKIKNCNASRFFCSKHIKETEDHIVCADRRKMRLTSVMCFRSYHFTSYVRDCTSENERWLHFDSMSGSTSEVKDVTKMLLKHYDQLKNTLVPGRLPCEIDGFFHGTHTCIYEPIYYNRSPEIHRKLKESWNGFNLFGWLTNKILKL